MQPVACACHIQAGFILMQDLRPTEGGFDLLLHWSQLLGTALNQPSQCAHAHWGSQQVLDHFTGALIGQQLLLHQVDAHCSHRRAILDRRSHIKRKRGSTDLLTGGAALLFCLVFDYHDALGRQINHLSTFHLQALHFAQVLPTVQTELDWVNQHHIGRRREQQGASSMSGLSSRLLLANLAQTLGLPMKAIAGGRQVTVVAVLFELFLQGLHLLSEPRHLLLHLGDQLISVRKLLLQEAFFFSQVHHFFFGSHIPTVLGSGLPSKPSSTRE
jgi:hypothetical protein